MADARLGLVIGCAEGNFDEARAAIALRKPDLVYCVKIAGIHWPERFDFWVGLHPEWQADYSEQRRKLGLPDGYKTVACLSAELGKKQGEIPVDRRCSYRWPGMNSSASSGIFGAKVALEDCDKVILAGIPMNKGKHFTRGKPWGDLNSFADGLRHAMPHLSGRVKSMSGKTQELLGAPDAEWLAGR